MLLIFALLLNSVYGSNITVFGQKGSFDCILIYLNHSFPCSLGQNGLTENKQEGDGCSPIGEFQLRKAFYRADRISKPNTVLEVDQILPNYGWCDDVASCNYNEFVTLPFKPSHEKLWFDAPYYDLMAVIGYNDNPVLNGDGSAIFFHVTENYGGTSGCVAMNINDLQWVLARIDIDSFFIIEDNDGK